MTIRRHCTYRARARTARGVQERGPMPAPSRSAVGLAAAAALTASSGVAAAQAPARDSVRTDPFCWRGRPLPHCQDFALFELGYHTRVVSTPLSETLDMLHGPSYPARRP